MNAHPMNAKQLEAYKLALSDYWQKRKRIWHEESKIRANHLAARRTKAAEHVDAELAFLRSCEVHGIGVLQRLAFAESQLESGRKFYGPETVLAPRMPTI